MKKKELKNKRLLDELEMRKYNVRNDQHRPNQLFSDYQERFYESVSNSNHALNGHETFNKNAEIRF